MIKTTCGEHVEIYGGAWREVHDRVVNARHQPILDMFETGKGRKSRQTETLFVERGLKLLAPGGWMGIVLPNGNLNSMSLAWLRRWVEGKAHVRGVVTLPVETFKFSQASVAASIVLFQKYTDEQLRAWELAWTLAHAALDESFNTRRSAAVRRQEPGVVSAGEDASLRNTLAELAAAGVHRTLGDPIVATSASLIRGTRTTKLKSPKWTGVSADENLTDRLQAGSRPSRCNSGPKEGPPRRARCD